MLTDNTILVFAVAGALILLALVQLFLATRHDRAVTAAGPIEELAIYERRLEEKQRLVDELENELEKRRQAMAVVADLQAEVDGLRRQKEELLAEWESLRERRDEVAAVRHETEAAVVERQQLETEIAPLRAEYLAIKEKLEKAEELLGRTEALKREYDEISRQVDELRDRSGSWRKPKTGSHASKTARRISKRTIRAWRAAKHPRRASWESAGPGRGGTRGISSRPRPNTDVLVPISRHKGRRSAASRGRSKRSRRRAARSMRGWRT